MKPKFSIQSKPIDFEICDLLGEGYSDFIVLCFDGVQFEGFGTPFDTPANRKERQELVDHLNDHSKDSWWPDLLSNWKPKICRQFGLPTETTASEYRPVVSWEISRVCVGYSEHLHAAIGLFGKLSDRIACWAVGGDSAGRQSVDITSKHGVNYSEAGESLPMAISLAVKRVLLDMPNNVLNNAPSDNEH